MGMPDNQITDLYAPENILLDELRHANTGRPALEL